MNHVGLRANKSRIITRYAALLLNPTRYKNAVKKQPPTNPTNTGRGGMRGRGEGEGGDVLRLNLLLLPTFEELLFVFYSFGRRKLHGPQ